MKTIRSTTTLMILLPALWLACATTAHATERMYKWVDSDGQVQYSNRMPPEAAKHQREEISESGRIIKVFKAPETPEEKAEAKRLAALEVLRKERERKRAIHDRSLLASYSSKADMINAQNDKVSMIESLIQLTHSRITSMRERLQKLTDEAAGFERSGKPLPFGLQQQIRNLRGQIDHNTQFASDKEQEIVEIKKQFGQDIARYEALTTAQPDDSKPKRSPLEVAMSKPGVKLSREDRTLLATFSSETDLTFARNEEISKVEEEIRTAFKQVDTLQKKLAEMTDNANEYDTAKQPVPQLLITQMKATMRDVAAAEKELKDKRTEKEQIEKRYNDEIARFHYLTASSR